MRSIVPVLFVFMAMGCAQEQPITAGGKSVEYWVGQLHAAKTSDRVKAVTKLRNIGAADPSAIPALTEAAKDNHAQVRLAAVQALGQIKAKSGVPALQKAAEDSDLKVRQAAGQALARIAE